MTLDEIAIIHGTDKSSGWHDYCRQYEPYFKPLRGKQLNILEIGVRYGRSIKTWCAYFPNAEIYGIDILEGCKKLERMDRIHILIGRQEDENFLRESLKGIMFDIIIDDGSHMPDHQLISFNTLYPNHLKSGGLYIIEDLCMMFSHHEQYHEKGYGIRTFLLEKTEQMMKHYSCGIRRMDFTKSLVIMTKA